MTVGSDRSRPASQVPCAAEFVDAAGPTAGEGTLFLCALCGCRFTHGERVCSACPMSAGCELVRCPNCGYQFPRSSRIVDAARRLWDYLRRSA